jgi:hypothetical protein
MKVMKTYKNDWALVLSGGGAMGLAHGRVKQSRHWLFLPVTLNII